MVRFRGVKEDIFLLYKCSVLISSFDILVQASSSLGKDLGSQIK